MSFEILEQTGTTTYAPIRSTIDGDRDYLRGDQQHMPGSVSHLSGLDRCNCGYQGLDGMYQDGVLPQGMLGEALARSWDSDDIVGLALIAGGAYGGYRLSEGASAGGRVAATAGGLMAASLVGLFLAFR